MPTTFKPARLVEGKTRWYIIFYQTDPKSSKLKPHRPTYDLNRIKDVAKRRKTGLKLVNEINQKLPDGFPYSARLEKLCDVNVIEALRQAMKIKIASTTRKRTVDMVQSMFNIFSKFIIEKKWEDVPVKSFGKKEAVAFLDYALIDKGIGPRTHNNYIERMRSMMNELVKREYIDENPFSKLTKMKELAKRRRAFNDFERDTLLAAVAKKGDMMLMLGILLQYYCFIRPIELRRLRFEMFDWRHSVIRLPGAITKNKEDDIVTIPNAILPFLAKFDFGKYNQRWLIFGKGVAPHPSVCCNHNILNHRQHVIIKDLNQRGMFPNMEGLSFYSWKDTGARELFKRKVNILEIMRQLRHKNLATTQKYCESLYEVNVEIKNLDNCIIGSAHLQQMNSID